MAGKDTRVMVSLSPEVIQQVDELRRDLPRIIGLGTYREPRAKVVERLVRAGLTEYQQPKSKTG